MSAHSPPSPPRVGPLSHDQRPFRARQQNFQSLLQTLELYGEVRGLKAPALSKSAQPPAHPGCGQELLPAFHCARAGNHHHPFTPNLHSATSITVLSEFDTRLANLNGFIIGASFSTPGYVSRFTPARLLRSPIAPIMVSDRWKDEFGSPMPATGRRQPLFPVRSPLVA